MDNLIAFLGLGSLLGLSMLFALWLEWLTLRALLYLMPGRAAERQFDGAARPSHALTNLQSGRRLAPVKLPG